MVAVKSIHKPLCVMNMHEVGVGSVVITVTFITVTVGPNSYNSN